MKIDKQLKRELIAFSMMVSGLLLTGQIKDLEALKMALEKLLSIVDKELEGAK
jgi:hypothetical protein